jgi:hypothetical protein
MYHCLYIVTLTKKGTIFWANEKLLLVLYMSLNVYQHYCRVLEREPTVSIELEWGRPSQTYGELKGYRLRYGVKDQPLKEQMFQGAMVHSHKINDLGK